MARSSHNDGKRGGNPGEAWCSRAGSAPLRPPSVRAAWGIVQQPRPRLARVLDLARGCRFCVHHPRLTCEVVRLRAALAAACRAERLDHLVARLAHAARVPRWPEAAVLRVTDALLRPPSPLRTSCLFRALVRFALLAPHDSSLQLVIGLRPAGDRRGHAWLQRGGAPLPGESAQGCVATFSYPP